MIIFHEGLPRSGKSYEAVVTRILPALKSGRKVFAYIEGLNHQKFAELLQMPLADIQRLLVFVPKENVKQIHDHIENDSLVIIDELQDFFPASKQPLDEKQTTFVTQHGHRGLDIVVMGQDHRDCHMLWKRRIDQLITFVKRDAIGMPNEYTWTTFKQKAGKFEKLNSGSGKYEPKYYGLYLSHEPSTLNKDTYTDDRANIFKSAVFRVYLPLFALVLCYAIYYLYGFLTNPESLATKKAKPATEQSRNPKGTSPTPPATLQPQSEPKPDPSNKISPKTYIESLLEKSKPRLSAIIETKDQTKLLALIEFVDDENKVIERLNTKQIVAFGFFVERKPYGLLLNKAGNQYTVTSFPVDRSKGVTRKLDSNPLNIVSNQ
jgi:zona occludens toxin